MSSSRAARVTAEHSIAHQTACHIRSQDRAHLVGYDPRRNCCYWYPAHSRGLTRNGPGSDYRLPGAVLVIMHPEHKSHPVALNAQYLWTLSTPSSKEVNALFAFAKKQLPGVLEAKFAAFPKVLLDIHGRDLVVPHPESNETSRTATPQPATNYSPAPPTSVAAPVKPKPKPATTTNTSVVTVQSSFMASGDDLFALLTDESRIPVWSRAPAQVCVHIA